VGGRLSGRELDDDDGALREGDALIAEATDGAAEAPGAGLPCRNADAGDAPASAAIATTGTASRNAAPRFGRWGGIVGSRSLMLVLPCEVVRALRLVRA
jgi:hypothetical protein